MERGAALPRGRFLPVAPIVEHLRKVPRSVVERAHPLRRDGVNSYARTGGLDQLADFAIDGAIDFLDGTRELMGILGVVARMGGVHVVPVEVPGAMRR